MNNGDKHHGKQFDSGVRTADEEVQLGGDRLRFGGLDNIVHRMAIFAIKPGPPGGGLKVLLVLVSLACESCAYQQASTPFGPNDHAFMVAQPYPREVALAKKRFQNFIRRADQKQRLTLAETPYVAVRAYQLTADDVPWLTWKMALGKIPMNDFYGADLLQNSGSVPIEFLLVFDQRTGELAAPDGVLVVGSPANGKIGLYGGVRAVYGGGGFW